MRFMQQFSPGSDPAASAATQRGSLGRRRGGIEDHPVRDGFISGENAYHSGTREKRRQRTHRLESPPSVGPASWLAPVERVERIDDYRVERARTRQRVGYRQSFGRRVRLGRHEIRQAYAGPRGESGVERLSRIDQRDRESAALGRGDKPKRRVRPAVRVSFAQFHEPAGKRTGTGESRQYAGEQAQEPILQVARSGFRRRFNRTS